MFKCHIEKDLISGRGIVTNEEVSKSEILVEELPFAYGPKQHSGIVCLGCYCALNFDENGDSLDRCEVCDWPLCSICNRSIQHRGECEIFSAAKVTFAGNVSEDGICTQLDCITPLRVLLAKELNESRWTNEIEPMEYHNDSRRQMTDIWKADLVNIAQYLRGPCKLADRFSEDLIMRVVGILEVNAFEARTSNGYPLRCLYPLSGILAHNCIPNTMRCIYPSEGYKIRLRAMHDLKSGEKLLHSYTYTLDGTAQRQEHIKTGKFFTCECERCKDPTELGTHFSTFKCHMCENGWILNTDPLDPTSIWKCTICEFHTSSEAIQKAVNVMQNEVSTVQSMELSGERLQEAEKLMRKYRSILHPLHYIQTSLRQSLIEMYGRVSGYELVELPDVLLERKEELCRQMLRVLNVFEPGLSRARAAAMYELHVPLVLQAKSAFIAGLLSKSALKAKLQEPIDLLQECVDILKYEDTTTQEGVLCKVAQQAVEQLLISTEGLQE